jgi:hypothetical protein
MEEGQAMWQKLRALRLVGKKMMLALIVLGVGVVAFCWGRHGALSVAKANPPTDPGIENAFSASHADYDKRPVAYLNNMPITRADLGEYLIARFGEQRLDFLINHIIIDMACKAQNIIVTDQMVMVELQENLKGFKMRSATEFQEQLLRRYNKTLYEWREDVIRPKLALRELARPRVSVTEQNLRDSFESHYGPQVQCRMILLGPDMLHNRKLETLAKVRGDEKAFMEEARTQAEPQLASSSGVVPPICKHFPDQNIEREAFSLKVGEVSGLIQLPNKCDVILRCEKLIPANGDKIYEKERVNLHKEVYETKLQQEIPKMFEHMRSQANIRKLMGNRGEDLLTQVQREIQPVSGVGNPPPAQRPAPVQSSPPPPVQSSPPPPQSTLPPPLTPTRK